MNTKINIEEYISNLDTERFGFKIAKINNFQEVEDLDFTIQKLKELNVKLIIYRVPSAEIELINTLEDKNFRIKDTQLTLKRDLKNLERSINDITFPKELIIREAYDSDIGTVGKIAYENFRGYGHYAANKNLDILKSNLIYKDWAEKSCINKNIANYMFVALIEDEIAGFLSLKFETKEGISLGIQHLGAVDFKFKNRNIFRRLIFECLITGINFDNSWQETYLLSTNYPVISSYLKMGFRISNSVHTMHSWL